MSQSRAEPANALPSAETIKTAARLLGGEPDPSRLVSVIEACTVLGKSKSWWSRNAGHLPYFQVGNSKRYQEHVVREFFESMRVFK